MERKWWHDKIGYQIYPKSFYDTNGDGIGDLRGIIEKLDYLKDLGADILWLSPCYQSPLADEGYDISDYYKIDPRFGTLEDMEELLAEAKKRDMYIVMDLVVSHCSDEHAWFQNMLQDPEGEYGDYFYTREGRDGKLPTNWRSYFGGPVWEPIPGTDKYYLHSFHKKQPDLNWENPKVRQEIYKMMCWWLDKGVAGFRADAIINIKKAFPLRDYPANRDDGLCDITCMLADAEGIQDFLQEMADQTYRKYDAFTVGEVFNEKEKELKDFIGEHGCFSTMFNFNYLVAEQKYNLELVINGIDSDTQTVTVEGNYDAQCATDASSAKGWFDRQPLTPEQYKACCFDSQEKVRDIGFYCNIIENHDEPRGASHYIPAEDCNDTSKKMLAAIQILQRGMPFLYQGQEIGMENIVFSSIDEVDDVGTLAEYQVALHDGLTEEEALRAVNPMSRDNGRTPFQWSDAPYAGFTTGIPWLRVNDNYKKINEAAQEQNLDSVLHFYKKLLALRKHPEYKEVFVYGDFIPRWKEQKNLLAFERSNADQRILVIANYQREPQEVTLGDDMKIGRVLLDNYDVEKGTPEWLCAVKHNTVKSEAGSVENAVMEIAKVGEPERKNSSRTILLKGYQVVVLELA